MGLKDVGTIIATAVIIAAVGCDSDTPVDPVPDDGARKLFDIPNADENGPEPTPDGRYILFVESYGQDYGYKRYLATYDLEKGEVTRITDDGDFPGGNLAISPDGKYLAYQNSGIWILPMDDGEPFQVCDDTLADICSWKPDSTAVVYGTVSGMYGLLKEVDVSTGIERVLLSEHIKGFDSGYYSPDGAKMLVTIYESMDFDNAFEIAVYGTTNWEKEETLLYTKTSNAPCYIYAGPWSPDGRKFLLITFGRGMDKYVDYYDLETNGVKSITTTPRTITDPRWSVDGEKVFFYGGPVGESMADERGIYVIDFPD
jgi:dipeptidyl aminopeptidase/acylaminoacyl peptidase